MGRLDRDRVAGGMLLIVGGFLLAVEHVPDLAVIIPLLIGLGLLGLFLVVRMPGLLAAGSVITGIGVGILAGAQGGADFGGAGILVSIGGGFLLLSLLGALFEVPSMRAWPLVPGFALVAVGAVIYAAGAGQQVLDLATAWWPVVLLAMGLYLLFAARMRLPLRTGAGSSGFFGGPTESVPDETVAGVELDQRTERLARPGDPPAQPGDPGEGRDHARG